MEISNEVRAQVMCDFIMWAHEAGVNITRELMFLENVKPLTKEQKERLNLLSGAANNIASAIPVASSYIEDGLGVEDALINLETRANELLFVESSDD